MSLVVGRLHRLDKAVTDVFYCFIIPFKHGFILSLLATARWLVFFAQPFRLDEVAYFWDVSWSLEGCTMYLLLDFYCRLDRTTIPP